MNSQSREAEHMQSLDGGEQQFSVRSIPASQEEAWKPLTGNAKNALDGTRSVAEPDMPEVSSGIHYSVRQYFFLSNNVEPHDT
jgi:hypothetical protein